MAGDLRGEKKGKLIAYLWMFSLKLNSFDILYFCRGIFIYMYI